MAAQPWRTGTIIRIENETYNTKRFFIKVNELESFDFKAGQFVTLDLPINEQKNKRWRSYSIASWPDGSNVFELLIVLLEDGAGTTYLFNEVQAGSELTFRGPQGVFTLPENIDKDLFFICTGTGVAPFRSMLNYMYLHSIPHKNLYLIFGCRTQKDLLYHEEMKALESKMKNFTYLPTLSREEWDGHKGYVHSLYQEICKKNNEGCEGLENLRPASFYLCGWKAMVDDARKNVAALGYDRKALHLELYG
ncbi:MAG: FAD-binding oxidoreductase [Bacteroidota bacterium]|jgi:glycine betaine catabolism B|nr:FAD-binding oxidoreductase [Bacteroidota bacterium]